MAQSIPNNYSYFASSFHFTIIGLWPKPWNADIKLCLLFFNHFTYFFYFFHPPRLMWNRLVQVFSQSEKIRRHQCTVDHEFFIHLQKHRAAVYSDGVRPWWRILVSQVLLLSDLMEMAADSHKDNNLVEMNASYTVVNSFPLCHWCSVFRVRVLLFFFFFFLRVPHVIWIQTLRVHTPVIENALLPPLLDSFAIMLPSGGAGDGCL